PAHYIAQANREKLGISGMKKIVAFDQRQSLGDFLSAPDANNTGTSDANKVATSEKIPNNLKGLCVGVVRSEGGEDGNHFNNLPRRAKATVHFRPIGVFA